MSGLTERIREQMRKAENYVRPDNGVLRFCILPVELNALLGVVEPATPQNAGATPTGKPQEVDAQNLSSSSSLLSPVEGRQPVDDDTKNDHGC